MITQQFGLFNMTLFEYARMSDTYVIQHKFCITNADNVDDIRTYYENYYKFADILGVTAFIDTGRRYFELNLFGDLLVMQAIDLDLRKASVCTGECEQRCFDFMKKKIKTKNIIIPHYVFDIFDKVFETYNTVFSKINKGKTLLYFGL